MKNTEIVNIPVYILERLLQSYYFEKSCIYNNISEWEKYNDVLLHQKQLAVEDIMKNNKEK